MIEVCEYKQVYVNYDFTEYPETWHWEGIPGYEEEYPPEDMEVDENYLANEICPLIPREEGPFEVTHNGQVFKGTVSFSESDYDWYE
jgi:hypothetical protein